MRNYIIAVLCCLLFCLDIKASPYFVETKSGVRFDISTSSSGEPNIGAGVKFYQLFFMLYNNESMLIKPKQRVHVNFGLYSYYCDESFGKQKYQYCLSICNNDNGEKDITINIFSNNFKIGDCLKLMEYGFNHNENDIKQDMLFAKNRGDFRQYNEFVGWVNLQKIVDPKLKIISSIPQETILEILQSNNELVDSFLKKRFYRNQTNYLFNNKGNIDFYTQNDSFYLFETSKNESVRQMSPIEEMLPRKASHKSIASFQAITDFSSDNFDNYLVFTSKDSFYHFKKSSGQIIGPIFFPRTGIERYDMYNSIIDSFSIQQDTIYIKNEMQWGIYYVKYFIKSGRLAIDSNTFPYRMKQEMEIMKTEREEISKAASMRRERLMNVLVLVSIMVLVNCWLIFTKKL